MRALGVPGERRQLRVCPGLFTFGVHDRGEPAVGVAEDSKSEF
jgi:hypothetical protein